jgi:hypothetical protein
LEEKKRPLYHSPTKSATFAYSELPACCLDGFFYLFILIQYNKPYEMKEISPKDGMATPLCIITKEGWRGREGRRGKESNSKQLENQPKRCGRGEARGGDV